MKKTNNDTKKKIKKTIKMINTKMTKTKTAKVKAVMAFDVSICIGSSNLEGQMGNEYACQKL